MKVLIATLSVIIVVASAAAQNMPKDWHVSLERTGCLGSCPTYKIVIDADGLVTFRHYGEAEKGKLSASEIQKLFRLSEAEAFLKLSADYSGKDDCDGPYETEWPSEFISVSANGLSRTITHNVGCKSRPNTFLGKLVELGSVIDKLTDGMFVKN